ncbi:MAG: PAS domain S-box protein, partial [Desulfovibrionaceae bacterium]
GHMALKNVRFAPLNVEGRTVGVVGLANKDGDFNERDLRMASALADLAAMALVRDRSLELLAESERKFRQLFEQAPVALWEQDFSEVKPELDRLWAEGVRDFPAHFRGRPALGWELVRKVRILDVNQAALALYGAESKGQLLEGLSTVFSEESLDGFLHSAQSLVDGGGRLEAERAHRSLDGRRLEVQLRWAVAEGHESNWDRVLVSVTDLTPLRQAEDEQRLMSFAMDQAPDPAFIVREDGAFQYVNQAACSRLGYEREELLNMAVPDVDLEFDRQRLRELQATLRSSGSSAVKLRSRHVDRFGQEFPVEITVRHVQYQGEECDIAFATDISEQERSLELLQASETRFRELFDNMSNGVAVYRPAGDAEDFLFQDLNKAGERITGLDRADIVGRSIQDVFPAVHEFGLFETLQRVARTGSSETFDIKKYSDERVDLWVSNAVYQLPSGEVVAVFNDEGERKRAEDELRRLAAAVEHAGETITITDRGGTILYVNPALRRLSGYSKEELIGRNPRILKSGKQSTAFYRRLWETILAGGVWRGRLVNQRKDGSLYEVDMTVSPVTSAEGEITHFVSIKRDVTEQVALERQLRESQKMEAIGALAGGIAHDFNNILMAVMGFVDLASRNLQDAGKAAAYLDYVKISSQRGADLVRQILTFSRTSETEKKPLDPAPVVKEAIRLLEATLPDNIAVTACVNDDPPRILSQPTALHQIVVNLGTNAMYAMAGAGGEMTIRLDGVDASQVDPPVPEAEADRWLLIQVSDTGAGMSEDVVQRAFEPFFTTKAPGQGAGLGLSVVHGLAKDHGGSIRIDSAPGQGAAVSVYLPACCEDADQMEPAPATDTPAGNERVLFVDDEQDLRTLVLAGLEELGYRVQTCESGDEALKLLQRDATAWDVAVTDLSMPGLGGAELAEAIRVLNPGLPVIICSGYAEATPGRGLGRPVLHKPFTPTDLARSIRDAITQRRNA